MIWTADRRTRKGSKIMERDPYKLWEMLGTWAAAIATFAAVIVSLRLARRAERPQVTVSVDQRLLLDPAKIPDPGNVQLDNLPDMIALTITNVGLTRVRINSVGWYWILIRGKGALQNPPDRGARSHDWPALLEHGDQLQWILPFEYLVTTISTTMLADSWWWRWKLQLLCVTVGTSTGHRFRARLGPTLKKSFAVETARIRANRPKG
jgi:hypothetical protein